VHNVVKGVVPYIRSQVQTYIALFNPNKAATDTVDVRVSFPVELDYWTTHLNGDPNTKWDDQKAPKADLKVSRTQLTNEILNKIPDITWLQTLPTH